jgi:RimJ/RimL family protein N-acetyltransferase
MVFSDFQPVAFCHLDVKEAKKGVLSGGLDPNLVGKGLGTIICCIFTDYIFSRLDINKVICEVQNNNIRSLRMLSKLGFQNEGIARDHKYSEKHKKYVDVHFWGMLKREYPTQAIRSILVDVSYEAG